MADLLVTGRRNFLVRALGFTAAGAALSVPVLAVTSPQDRIQHHLKGLQEAFQDLYGRPAAATFSDGIGVQIGRDRLASGVAMVSAMPEHAGTVRWFLDSGGPMLAADAAKAW